MPNKEVHLKIWDLLPNVPDINPYIWKKDFAGAWIRKDQYQRQTIYGWTIEKITPLNKGGKIEDINNWHAVHWINHDSRGGGYPEFKSRFTSKDSENIKLFKNWKIIDNQIVEIKN